MKHRIASNTVALKTRWTPGDAPLQEYPRPQAQRQSYLNLNGFWRYAIRKNGAPMGVSDGEILVPYAPETLLSGVGKTLMPDETLFYERTFRLPKGFIEDRVILHFGAVDSEAEVFLNDARVGAHRGGYNAFWFDVTPYLNDGDNSLRVEVRDDTDAGYATRGKQTFRRGGIWYAPTSGIWQTVWIESVPERYVERLEITPDFDGAAVAVKAIGADLPSMTVEIYDSPADENGAFFGAPIAAGDGAANGVARVALSSFVPWTPDEPKLYGIKIKCGFDTVCSYFGMRKFEVKKDEKGISRFFLNDRPFFMHGLLDQGYFSDGMYTPPADEAMADDVKTAKRLGFNTLRKHIKVEPMRWYYHCDRLGVLVMQDMPSGGARYRFRVIGAYPFVGIRLDDSKYRLFGRQNETSRTDFNREYREMLEQLKNVVSLAVWVPFNEGWGQFDANKTAELTRRLDLTRPVDHASGWHDQDGGDFNSLHVYFKPVKRIRAERRRATILSEFGGYSLKVENHCFNLDKTFGYKVFKTREKYNEAFIGLYRRDVVRHIKEGLSADVYTELTDVEDEVNGVVTFDREVVKLDEAAGEAVRRAIEAAFDAAVGPAEKKGDRDEKRDGE